MVSKNGRGGNVETKSKSYKIVIKTFFKEMKKKRKRNRALITCVIYFFSGIH